MGVGEAAGRLVEFCERERGAQFEAARFLLLGDADGGEKGLFRGRGVGGVLFEKDFAANAMTSASCQRCPVRSDSTST